MRFEETIGISSLLNHVEHELSQKIEQSLRPLGLTLPQYSTLSYLEMGKVLTNADLARKCYVTPQTMNRILQNLLKLKLVKKTSAPHHRLKMHFTITPIAIKLVCKAHILINEIELNAISGLNKKDYSDFEKSLKMFLANLST